MKVLSFGEPLLVNYLETKKLTSSCTSYFNLGGSEINTLISLADLGAEPFLISTFPGNNLGREFIEFLKEKNINTKYISQNDDEIIGSVYIKDNQHYYQRKNSAFTNIDLYEINFENILKNNFDWVHLTGITPQLNYQPKILWKELIRSSLEKNIKVSISFNYDETMGFLSNLWELVKPYLDKIELIIFSQSDLLEICELENLSTNSSSENLLKELCQEFKIKKGVVNINTTREGKEYNRTILVSNEIIYSSNVKESSEVNSLKQNDIFVAYLIKGLNENNNNFSKLLNESITYSTSN